MTMPRFILEKREEILRRAQSHGAVNVRVFGSTARGEHDTESDVDFLVDIEEGRTLLDLSGLLLDLEEILGCEVDVATENGLKKRVRDRVLREAARL